MGTAAPTAWCWLDVHTAGVGLRWDPFGLLYRNAPPNPETSSGSCRRGHHLPQPRSQLRCPLTRWEAGVGKRPEDCGPSMLWGTLTPRLALLLWKACPSAGRAATLGNTCTPSGTKVRS